MFRKFTCFMCHHWIRSYWKYVMYIPRYMNMVIIQYSGTATILLVSDCLLSFYRVMGKCKCQDFFFFSFSVSIRTCHRKLVTMGTDISSLPSTFSASSDPCGILQCEGNVWCAVLSQLSHTSVWEYTQLFWWTLQDSRHYIAICRINAEEEFSWPL